MTYRDDLLLVVAEVLDNFEAQVVAGSPLCPCRKRADRRFNGVRDCGAIGGYRGVGPTELDAPNPTGNAHAWAGE